MWGFVVDKAHWGRFYPSTSVSPANHSTNFSIITITRGWHNRPVGGRSAEWTQLDSSPHYTNLKKIQPKDFRSAYTLLSLHHPSGYDNSLLLIDERT
jgi:hypothetical protein